MATYASLTSRIPEIILDLPGEVRDALEEGAGQIAEEARARVPVDSGDLKAAIHTEEVPGGWAVVAGNENVFYGHIVEHGGVNTPPRPFLVPAAEQKLAEVVSIVEQALEDL